MDLSTRADVEFNKMLDFIRDVLPSEGFHNSTETYEITKAQEKALLFEYEHEITSNTPYELDGRDYSIVLFDGYLEVGYCEEVGVL